MTDNSRFKELTEKLKEIFQIRQDDTLDFGIYRIMNMRRKEIDEFLTKTLSGKIQIVLAKSSEEERKSIQHDLDQAIANAKNLGVDPDAIPKVKELKEKLAAAGSDPLAESEVYSHLLTFFSRYYDNGDFVSKRRYNGDKYAIPYAGEEVKLYWTNADQYYVKTGENFSNFDFVLDNGNKVHFKLLSADITKDNVKDNDAVRGFVLYDPANAPAVDENADDPGEELPESFMEVKEFSVKEKDSGKEKTVKELFIYFQYVKMGKSDQKKFLAEAEKNLTQELQKLEEFQGLLANAPTEKDKNRTLLKKYLTQYAGKNKSDYFIHKDLKAFLTRELDFYIKNEMMHLDDVQNAESFKFIEMNLRKIQAVRQIALELIEFMAQIEEFQKKLWLKKKFVTQCDYCITLDRLPEELKTLVFQNQDQIAEWKELGLWNGQTADNAGKPSTVPSEGLPLYNHALMVDTKFFDEKFKAKLLSSIDDLDEQCDGVIIHSENFQALNLLQERYKEKIDSIYIDPPYNTGSDGFVYKDSYQHSSWISMMENRLELIRKMQKETSSISLSINENEVCNLIGMMNGIFTPQNYITNFAVRVRHEDRILKGDKDIHEVYESLVSYKKSNSFHVSKREKDNTSNEEYKWYVSVKDSPCTTVEMNRKTVEIYQPGSFEITQGQGDASGMKKISVRGSIRKGNSSGRFYVANLEPVKDQYAGYLFKVSNMGDDGLGYRWFYIPAKEKKRKNGDYFQGVPLDRKDILEIPYPNFLDFETDFNDCSDEGGVEFHDGKKPIHFIQHIFKIANINLKKDAVITDYFAGSGSTGHAVIDLNRKDGGYRKYILVEMGDHFNTVLKPRLEKVVYSPDWKDGEPETSAKGISHCFKYMTLESYEDALNNIEREDKMANLPGSVQEEFLLKYMLELESRGSQINTDSFKKPFDYKLKIAVDSAGATQEQNVDLIETFNYLIGLTVTGIDRSIDKGYVFVTGRLPGETKESLIIWRDCDKISNAKLNELLEKKGINAGDSEYATIFVNGDHAIRNVRIGGDEETVSFKVRQIENEFLSKMFEVK